MGKKFDWLPYFKKISEKKSPKKIAECRVCGDILFYADDEDIANYNWHPVVEENTNEHCMICQQCWDFFYYTNAEAEEIDKSYIENGESPIDIDGLPYRGFLTWDEAQAQSAEYKKQLKAYVEENHPELMDYFTCDTLPSKVELMDLF